MCVRYHTRARPAGCARCEIASRGDAPRTMVRHEAIAIALLAWLPSLAAAQTDPLADKVARMASVGSSVSPSFAPDGASLAFVSTLTGVPQVLWSRPTARTAAT